MHSIGSERVAADVLYIQCASRATLLLRRVVTWINVYRAALTRYGITMFLFYFTVERKPSDHAIPGGCDLSIYELSRAVALKTRLAEKTGCVSISDIFRCVIDFLINRFRNLLPISSVTECRNAMKVEYLSARRSDGWS